MRWPADPASWELQVGLARPLLLEAAVGGSRSGSRALPAEGLPDPRPRAASSGLRLPSSARVRARLARRRWQDLLLRSPGFTAGRA